MSKTKKLKYKVTNKNMLIRYQKEQENDKNFNLSALARKFGMLKPSGKPDKTIVCRWVSLKKGIQRLPPKNRICPGCKKSLFEHVEKWVNDGTIN